jgi:hypothetical protein
VGGEKKTEGVRGASDAEVVAAGDLIDSDLTPTEQDLLTLRRVPAAMP